MVFFVTDILILMDLGFFVTEILFLGQNPEFRSGRKSKILSLSENPKFEFQIQKNQNSLKNQNLVPKT